MEEVYRLATPADLPRMREIYAYYVEHTTVSFEYTTPDADTFAARFCGVTVDFPWFVCEVDGRVAGYAYAGKPFGREAYGWDASSSVYIDEAYHHRGIGRRLVSLLENTLRELGYHNLYAVVTGSNTVSCQFHEQLGYTLAGNFTDTGFKNGEWLDVRWYVKQLLPPTIPEPVKAFQNQEKSCDGACKATSNVLP